MDTFELFTRYARAIVSKKMTRREITQGKGRILSRQRLQKLEELCFDNHSYKFYEQINNYMNKKGL